MESAKSTAESTLNDEPEVVVKRETEHDLITWTAPARPFKRYGRKFYVTIFSIVGIISIILFVAEGLMPVVLLISLIFLFYILSTVEPEKVEYKVTNKGIKIAGKETPWQNVIRFWFRTRPGAESLVLDTASFLGRMEMVITPEVKDKLKNEISAYVPYQEMPPTTLDKVMNWVINKLPEGE